MDFRGVSRLYADPEWDDSVDISPDFDPEAMTEKYRLPPLLHRSKPVIYLDGCPVEITSDTV